MKAVVDTNVIYSALYSSRGASRVILQDIRHNRITPVLTVALYEEYSAVLRRSPLSLSDQDTDILLGFLCKKAILQEVFYLWRPFLVDPKDDMLIEAAVASDVRFIITHNVKDFIGAEQFNIKAIQPKEYLGRRKKK